MSSEFLLRSPIANHICQDHGATLHPPGKPDGKAIGGLDEDMYLLHSIYFPNCYDPYGTEIEVSSAAGSAEAPPTAGD